MLLAVFLVSGVSGLVYQVAWFRQLGLVFGVTSHALGVVLAAFMAGLALGAFAGGWLAPRLARPLLAYAVVEIGIGVLAILVLPALGLVQSWYVALAPGFADRDATLAVLRFVLAFVVLLPPTICMGATLPLLLAAGAHRPDDPAVGRLYAINTAGAVIGALLAGFLLIGMVGLRASCAVAALLNILAGLAVASRGWRGTTPPATPSEAISLPAPPASQQRVVLLAFALSGFTALALEVIWTRLIAILTLGVVYGFTLMLAVLLVGLAAGSALYSRRRDRRADPVLDLAGLELAIGLLVGASPLIITALATVAPRVVSASALPVLTSHCVDCVITLPALLVLIGVVSFLFGATFPVVVRAIPADSSQWTTSAGTMYAANVIGGVAGSLLAGFWWLPKHGAHAATLGIAVVNVLVAAALLGAAGRTRWSLAALAAGFAVLAPSAWSERFDLYRAVLASRLGADSTVEWSEEGLESSVAVARRPSGERFILINGSIHASTRGHAYHQRLGHIGPLVHPAPRDVLVIGLGGGTTAGTIALYPDARVHVVELSTHVLDAARRLRDINHDVIGNDRVTISIDDGRNHLLVSGRRYDVIEADVLEPRKVGASVVYSREFFETARMALAPGGIMVQWLGSSSHLEYHWALRTFRAAFPHVQLWMNGDVAVGASAPIPAPDRDRFERLRSIPRLRTALDESGLETYEQVVALRLPGLPPPDGGPLVTDDRPSLEYFLTLPLLTNLLGGRP